MPEPITLSLTIGAVVVGVVEALASKAVEKTPALAQRIGKLLKLQQTLPLSDFFDALQSRLTADRDIGSRPRWPA